MKLYKNSMWLKRKYLIEKKTAKEIAEICGVTEMTIFRHLQQFGLIRNSRTWGKRS